MSTNLCLDMTKEKEIENIEPPNWHEKVLKERQIKAKSKDANYLTVPEVRERLRKKTDK